MADPLSVTAGVIAVVGAAEAVSKALSKIKSIRNAPSEVLALINEVSDLRVILGEIERYLGDANHANHPTEQLQTINALVGGAKDCLLEIDQLIQYRLVKAHSTATEFRVSRREWAGAKSTIERFRQRLREIRLNMITQMVVINSSHQSRIGLTIDDIYIISGQIRASQLSTTSRTLSQLDEHSRALSNILNGQAELQELLRLGRFLGHSTLNSVAENASAPVIGIRSYVPQHQKFPYKCSPCCKCKCHRVHKFQTPDVLYRLVGLLFVGYSGHPTSRLRPCTEASCLSRSTFRTYVHYFFPAWITAKALSAVFSISSMAEIQVSLIMRRTVPIGAEIFRLQGLGDIKGLKQLFRDGLASPNDSDNRTGSSVLQRAVFSQQYEVCEFLLSAGADPNLADLTTARTPFQAAWSAIFSCKSPNAQERFRTIFPANDENREEFQFSKLHETILGLVSSDLDTELVQPLVDIDTKDSWGKSALCWAAQRGDDYAVNRLMKANADVNLASVAGFSALSEAARSGSASCTRLLLAANADVHQGSGSFYNALHRTLGSTSSGEIIKLLIEAGVDPDVPSIYGAGPLAYTAVIDNVAAATTLLDLGADVNFQDHDGDTPIIEAIFRHKDTVAQLFLQRGADYKHISSDGRSVLHLAAQSGGMRTLDILIAAELEGLDPHSQNPEGKTPIQVAQERRTKPDGFFEKMNELILDIDKRNLRLAQFKKPSHQKPVPSTFQSIPASEPSAVASTTRWNYAFHQAMLSCSVVWKTALEKHRRVREVVQQNLRQNPFITLFLGCAIGIVIARLPYSWSKLPTAQLEDRQSQNIIYLGDGTET